MHAAVLAVLILASSRIHVPVGTSVRDAESVAIANISNGAIAFTEVLKGRAAAPRVGPYEPLPANAQGIALLMAADGTVLQMYARPEQVRAVRALVPLYGLRGERARLVALRDLLLGAKSATLAAIYREQLVADFKTMREPENLQLVIDLFDPGDEATRRAVIEVLAFIGDRRAVPLLVRALRSPPSDEARGALETHFPGTIAPRSHVPRNDYQRVVQLLERDDEAATRPLFLRMLDQPDQLEAAVQFLPDWIQRMIAAHPKQAARIREVLIPLLTRLARSDNYLWKAAAARTLRELRHPSTAPALFLLLESRDPLFDESKRIAAHALYDLGDPLRAAAVSKLPPGAFDAPLWTLYRRGESRDARAVPELVRALRNSHPQQPVAVEALRRIGGAKVEEAMQPLLRDRDLQVRRAAMEVLFHVQRRRFLPALRRMLDEPGFGDVPSALTYLAHLGEPSDLAVLVPRSDFWTGYREHHYWLMSAIAEIRRRHRVNVPSASRGTSPIRQN